MLAFPATGEQVVRVLGFPVAETFAVGGFAANRCIGLGVVAHFVENDVFEENARDPVLT